MSFFVSAVHALISFTYDLLYVPVDVPVTVRYVPPKFDPFLFSRQIVGEFVDLVPVALVAHLLARTGETMRRIGFDATRPRFDLTVGLGLAVLAQAVGSLAMLIAHALDLPFRPLIGINADANASAIALLVLGSVVAGISEETILTGYLLTRLGDIGWTFWRAAGASILLRAAFHLYQGIGGFIFNIVGGLVAALVFRRTKRVMPLVVAHIAIDLISFGASFFFPDLVARVQ